MGYAKGKSVPSLVAGCTLGGTFALAGYMLQQNSGETGTSTGLRQGHDIALGASTVTVGTSSGSLPLHHSLCVRGGMRGRTALGVSLRAAPVC
jgi:uncharacterized membrane protein (UPF0136 family)